LCEQWPLCRTRCTEQFHFLVRMTTVLGKKTSGQRCRNNIFKSWTGLDRGCQIFLCSTHQNGKKYPKGSKNITYGCERNQKCPFQGFKKTKFGIFGMKINHLATLDWMESGRLSSRSLTHMYVCTFKPHWHNYPRGRFLNRVQVENFSSSKLEVNKFIPIKFATCKLSTWTRCKNRPQIVRLGFHEY
jgi:hypothetical protein